MSPTISSPHCQVNWLIIWHSAICISYRATQCNQSINQSIKQWIKILPLLMPNLPMTSVLAYLMLVQIKSNQTVFSSHNYYSVTKRQIVYKSGYGSAILFYRQWLLLFSRFSAVAFLIVFRMIIRRWHSIPCYFRLFIAVCVILPWAVLTLQK